MFERQESPGGGSIGQGGHKVTAVTSIAQPRVARRHFPAHDSTAAGTTAAALACLAAIVLCGLAPAGEALVSYCRDSSPHSYSLQQAEVICETEGEYNFRLVVDKSNQRNLYDDLGEQNVGRRFTAMTLDDKTVAKYANLSEFVLHVEVLDAGVLSTAHHCCQVCRIDCEQMRYACPRRYVDPNDTCAPKETELETCRFSEDVLDVRARVLCTVKAKSREIPTSWYYEGFSLRTSPRNCPYRKLEKGEHYVVMATLSTPNYGREDTLVGADMIVAVPKKYKSVLPTQYLRGVPGLSLLSVPRNNSSNSSTSSAALFSNRTAPSRNGGRCPTEKALKALKLSSSRAAPQGHRRSGRGHVGVFALWTVVAAAVATAAARPERLLHLLTTL